MRRIGEVVRAVGGIAIVRSPDDSHPSVGETAVDESLSPAGRVVDVMGPVDRPYVVIDADSPPAGLLNERLYVR